MTNDHYHSFIHKAFIEPIRSVLIVDDQFPTYDDILNDTGTGKDWHGERDRVANLIKKFRQRDKPLLVDIHDGTNLAQEEEVTTAGRLHQCDLLVLDYELDKASPEDPARAIEILRAAMSNTHFNLVVVYTVSDLDEVFDAIRWGIVSPFVDFSEPIERNSAQDLVSQCEEIDEGFERRLTETVGSEQYFYAWQNQSTYLETMLNRAHPFTFFESQASLARWKDEQKKLVLRYFLKCVEDEYCASGEFSAGSLEWSAEGLRWIKSDSAFVAFSRKITSGDPDLLDDLQGALCQWNPRPSRLFLTKLRAEMDEHGIAAQGSALSNHHALAYWYLRLLQSKSDRKWRIAESVSRHSQQLLQAVHPKVEKFVSRLIDSEEDAGKAVEICRHHFDVDLTQGDARERAELEHNMIVCSKRPEGWHLETGHVFAITGAESEELWLCLSPACDMVHSQGSQWRDDTFGEYLPFLAVRLWPTSTNQALKKITTNRYICLNINDEIKCYRFNSSDRESSSPDWHIFYAAQKGEFTEGEFQLTIVRIRADETNLISEPFEAKVVAQLRYEYALNLIQKLGTFLTRVGLDFAKVSLTNA